MQLKLHPVGHECAPSLNCGAFGDAIWGTLDGVPVTFAVGVGGIYTGLLIYTEGHLSEDEFRARQTYNAALINRGPVCYHAVVFGTERLVYPIAREGGELPGGQVCQDIQEVRGINLPLLTITDALHQPRGA